MPDIELTYLGWQGWLFQSANARIMVDGLLVDRVGRGPPTSRVEFLFHTARRFHWETFNSLDAYFITHEHEDHFNLPTLQMLDRQMPIYIANRVSVAAKTILSEMGFRNVHFIQPRDVVTVRDLSLEFFCNPQSASDEWETLAYLLRHGERPSLFTNVDVDVTSAMREQVNEAAKLAPDLLLFGSMALQRWTNAAADEIQADKAHRPQANASRFLGDPEAALATLQKGAPMLPHSGMTVAQTAGRVVNVRDGSPWLESTPRTAPSRPFRKTPGTEMSPPLSGDATVSEGELIEVEVGLQDLAQCLYGRSFYKKLLAVERATSKGRNPTYALILLCGEDQTDLAFEYRPGHCDFVALRDEVTDIEERYLGVVLMWARDFLSMSRGQIEPRTIGMSYDEIGLFGNTAFWEQLWIAYHPQRIPKRVLEQYRVIAAAERDQPIRLFWSGKNR